MTEADMTLLTDWEWSDPAGWFVSEKFDGCRAYWDGSQFWTRSGKIIKAPKEFCEGLPGHHLDGEIWAGRGKFTVAGVAVRLGRFVPGIQFIVFDVPGASGNLLERLACAEIKKAKTAKLAKVWECNGQELLFAERVRFQNAGAEGLVIKSPAVTSYERGRTANALKVK